MKGRVVIAGAGFGGITVAQELARLLPDAGSCDIVVVDKHDFSLFTPMLTEVVGGEVDPEEIVISIRSLAPRVTFEQGSVVHIDADARSLMVSVGDDVRGIPTAVRTIHADHLVIALGSPTNFHGIAGLQEHALTVKSVSDGDAIRRRAVALLERGDEESDRALRRSLLTFVVGGGGFSGVETMAALNDMVRDLVTRYPNVAPDDVRTLLVDPGDRILPELPAGLAQYAHRKLAERGVEVRLSTEITGAGSDHVDLKDAGSGRTERVDAYTCVWAGGIEPNPVIDGAHLQLGSHHGILVDRCCQVPGRPGVWALGDCAEVPKGDGEGTYAPTAQNAVREGRLVARNVVAALRSAPPEPFNYRPIGELALVGRRSGVASLYSLRVSGIAAWVLWRAVYLLKVPTRRQRIRIAAHWLMDLAFGRPAVGPMHDQDSHPEAKRAA